MRATGPDEVMFAEEGTACDRRVPVKLRICPKGPGSMTPLSIVSALRHTADTLPNRAALGTPRDSNPMSWLGMDVDIDVDLEVDLEVDFEVDLDLVLDINLDLGTLP